MATLLLPSPQPSASRQPAAPRWATPRDPDRSTYGPAVGKIAAVLGRPLFPWQQQVVDTALEVDDDGRLIYRRVVLTVPRQQGKSTLLLPVLVHRMLGMAGVHGKQECTYAAQTGVMARKKFLEDYADALQHSVLAAYLKVSRNNGMVGMRFTNGSNATITAATEKAGHGTTLDLAFIDEAFSYTDSRLEQAFVPAMQTRKDAQLWIVSTAGTQDSVYLRAQVDRGRALVESGQHTSTAYFEWSAPEDADPADPETWWSCMPSLGRGVQESAVRAAFEGMELDEFCRAFLNQWRYGKTAQQVIDAEHWTSCADPGCDDDCTLRHPHHPGMQFPEDESLVLALDVSPSRTQSSIAAAGLSTEGLPGVEVVATGEGTEWCIPRLRALREGRASDGSALTPPVLLVIDGAGPAASLVPDLLEDGWTQATSTVVERDGPAGQLLVTNRQEMTAACGHFYDVARQRRLRHRSQPSLNAALAAAARRDVGDAWAWGRKTSAADITPLVAATLAEGAHAKYVRAGVKPTAFADSYY